MNSIQELVFNGYTVSKNGAEISDLGQYRRYNKKMQIQVYKRAYQGKEYCEIFYNINDAINKFDELSK